MEAVGNLIKKINKNDTLYESFLDHKTKLKVSNKLLTIKKKEHPIIDFECFVCQNVHRNNYSYMKRKRNIYKCPKPNVPNKENTWNQHWDIGKCQSKALKLLVNKDQPYSMKLFDETWKTLLNNYSC